MERYGKIWKAFRDWHWISEFPSGLWSVLCNEFALPPSAMIMMAENPSDTVLWYWDSHYSWKRCKALIQDEDRRERFWTTVPSKEWTHPTPGKITPSSNLLHEGLCQVFWRVKILSHAMPFEVGTSPSSGSLWCPSDTPVAMMQSTSLSFCMWCVEIWNGRMGGGRFLDDGWGELLNRSTTSSTILQGWVSQNHAKHFWSQTPIQRVGRWLTMEDQAV